MKKSLADRLLAKSERQGTCLVWTGARVGAEKQYAQITNESGRKEYVHRVSHRLFIGPIPDGYQVDHVRANGCVSTVCIEPSHLEAVTPRMNVGRSTASGAVTIRTGKCPRGHRQSPENVYVNRRNGNRQCRPCKTAKTVESNRRRALQKETA